MSQPSDRGRLVKVFGVDCGASGGILIVQVLSESAVNSLEPSLAAAFPVTNRNHKAAENQNDRSPAEILRKETGVEISRTLSAVDVIELPTDRIKSEQPELHESAQDRQNPDPSGRNRHVLSGVAACRDLFRPDVLTSAGAVPPRPLRSCAPVACRKG